MDIKNLNNFSNFKFNKDIDLTNVPKLIEPGVKYFFKNILEECNKYKQKNYSLYFNIVLFGLFFLILGIILYSRYKGNKSAEAVYLKNLKDKQYIMSKLVYYNRQNIDNNQRIRNNMITNLPNYSNNPEADLLHKKIYF